VKIELSKPQKTLVLCSAFIAGTGFSVAGQEEYLITVSLLIGMLLVFFLKNYLSLRLVGLALAVFVLSVFYTDFRMPQADGLLSIAPADMELRGKVVSEPRGDLNDKTKFHFKVNEVKYNGDWLGAKAKTIVYIYDNRRKFEDIKIGDLLELKGSVNPPYKATNPGEFDYGKYLNRKGVFTMTYVRYDNYEITGDSGINPEFFQHKLNLLRNKILEVHKKYLDSPKIELLGGMVFGDHVVPVPENVEDSFIKSGLLHLLAASGLNVGIIFGIWFFIATRAGMPFRLKIIAGMLLVVVYAFLTGLPPSVTRAALMLEFVLLGKLLDRRADSYVLLVLVGVLILLFNPLMISDVSFQLSFVVTLGLLLFVPPLVEKTKPVPEVLSGALWVPLVAQVFVVPIQAYYFNTFASYSVPANILVVPFVGIISFSGFIGSISALVPVIGDKICFIADKIAEPFISLLLFVSNYTAEFPGALLDLPQPGWIQIAFYYLFLFFLFIALKKNFSLKKYNIAVITVFLVLLVLLLKGNFINNKKLEFIFFDVGEGDSVLVKTPEKKYILVDTGPPAKYSPARTAIVPYLKDKGIRELDAVVLTHPDSDHIGGTAYILENIKVNMLFHNGIKRDTKNYLITQKSIIKNKIKTAVLNDKEEISLDKKLKITVIRPENVDLSDNNEDSIILYIIYKNFSALLMADCEADSLQKLKNIVQTHVDLLKVGHHGSYNSVNKEFMEYIKPEIAVISVGKRGYYMRHPHPQVKELLKKYGAKIFRTDRDYAIKVKTDGDKIDLITLKQDKGAEL